MSKSSSEIIEFVLEKTPAEPAQRRIRLYRAVAAIIPAEDEARRLNEMASDLEVIEQKHAQLLLDFRRRIP